MNRTRGRLIDLSNGRRVTTPSATSGSSIRRERRRRGGLKIVLPGFPEVLHGCISWTDLLSLMRGNIACAVVCSFDLLGISSARRMATRPARVAGVPGAAHRRLHPGRYCDTLVFGEIPATAGRPRYEKVARVYENHLRHQDAARRPAASDQFGSAGELVERQ